MICHTSTPTAVAMSRNSRCACQPSFTMSASTTACPPSFSAAARKGSKFSLETNSAGSHTASATSPYTKDKRPPHAASCSPEILVVSSDGARGLRGGRLLRPRSACLAPAGSCGHGRGGHTQLCLHGGNASHEGLEQAPERRQRLTHLVYWFATFRSRRRRTRIAQAESIRGREPGPLPSKTRPRMPALVSNTSFVLKQTLLPSAETRGDPARPPL